VKLLVSYKILLPLFCVFAVNFAAAQDEATSRFIDSLKKPPAVLDTVLATAPAVDEPDGDSTVEEEMPVDTAIISHLREISADTILRIKKDKGFYYQSWLDSLLKADELKLENKKPPPSPDLSFLKTFINIFKIVLWILAGGLLLFILYKLFFGNTAIFLKTKKNIDVSIDLKEEQIPPDRYDKLIKKAELEGDYRSAVRFLHLQALYNLSQKGYIQLGLDKTNYQYINELMNRQTDAARLFTDLTYRYEYIWYGEYPISAFMYSSLRASFESFNHKIMGS